MTATVKFKINFSEFTLIEYAIDCCIKVLKNHLETQALFDDDQSDLIVDISSYVNALKLWKMRGEEALKESRTKGSSYFEIEEFFSNVRVYRACLNYLKQDLERRLAEGSLTPLERQSYLEKVASCERVFSYLTQRYDLEISKMMNLPKMDDGEL